MNEHWIEGFWDLLRPMVSTGDPVYFAIDGETIRRIASEVTGSNLSILEARISFNAICRSYIVDDPYLSLSESCYKKTSVGFSAVILLCAQQVSIVELMATNDHISDESYFPVYRSELGLNVLTQVSPFEPGTFQKLWGTLADEILTINGSRRDSITFSEGMGAHKNKNFPLSQALLTFDELCLLNERSKKQMLNIKSPQHVRRFLISQRHALGPRSARLVMNHFQQGNILTQLLRFLQNPAERYVRDVEQKIQSVITSGKFALYTDLMDIFSESFTLSFRRSFNDQENGESAFKLLGKLPGNPPIATFLDNGSFFEEIVDQYDLQCGDKIIFAISREKISAFRAIIDNTIGWASLEGCTRTLEVMGAEGYFFFQVARWKEDFSALTVYRGHIGKKAKSDERSISFAGGIVVDRRSNTYLTDYPPTAVYREKLQLPTSTIVSSGGKKMQLFEFLNGLGNYGESEVHLLEVDGNRIPLRLERIHHLESLRRIGYIVDDDLNAISLVSTDVTGESERLIGLKLSLKVGGHDPMERQDFEYSRLTPAEISILLVVQPNGATVCKEEVEHLISLIPSEIPIPVRKHLIRLLRTSRKIPQPLLSRVRGAI